MVVFTLLCLTYSLHTLVQRKPLLHNQNRIQHGAHPEAVTAILLISTIYFSFVLMKPDESHTRGGVANTTVHFSTSLFVSPRETRSTGFVTDQARFGFRFATCARLTLDSYLVDLA